MCRLEEQKAHPEEVVNSLKTYEKSVKGKRPSTKFMLVATTIRESDEVLESDSGEEQGDPSFTDAQVESNQPSAVEVSCLSQMGVFTIIVNLCRQLFAS